MRLLLDTHVLLALLKSDRPLRPGFEARLAASDSELLVSVATLWEIAIKVRSGKLALDIPLTTLPDHLLAWNCRLIDVGSDHVLAELDSWPDTQDTFDRLLLATAHIEGGLLITWDRVLLAHPLAWQPGSA